VSCIECNYWEPVEVAEDGGYMGEFGKLNTRCAAAFWMHCKGLIEAECIQERVAVELGDDQCLDQDLCCFMCEEGVDPADVVESNSTRLGHRGDVGDVAQLVVQHYAKVSCSR